jgi:hypothetical protein
MPLSLIALLALPNALSTSERECLPALGSTVWMIVVPPPPPQVSFSRSACSCSRLGHRRLALRDLLLARGDRLLAGRHAGLAGRDLRGRVGAGGQERLALGHQLLDDVRLLRRQRRLLAAQLLDPLVDLAGVAALRRDLLALGGQLGLLVGQPLAALEQRVAARDQRLLGSGVDGRGRRGLGLALVLASGCTNQGCGHESPVKPAHRHILYVCEGGLR